MNSIRYFLWALVAAMTLQGYYKADEYGSAASMIGGMSLTLSVWGETLGEGMRTLFGGSPSVTIPRAMVVAAVQETARKPGFMGSAAPQMRKALRAVQDSWTVFSDAHVEWMLRHAAIVGGLQADPAGRALWFPWSSRVAAAETAALKAKSQICGPLGLTDECKRRKEVAAISEETLVAVRKGKAAWKRLLAMESGWTTQDWWMDTNQYGLIGDLSAFYKNLTLLHDVASRADPRVGFLLDRIRSMSKVMVAEGDGWRRNLVESLLTADLWTTCLDHVRARENRIRELMATTGIQELFNVHDRLLNASLRIMSGTKDRDLVATWFGEMGAHAWWVPEDMPAIVRRCVGHEGGDCRRVGATEIAALTSQADVAASIVQDWTRRVFIGMWNALPAVGLLFIVEFAVLCLGIRGPRMMVIGDKIRDQSLATITA
jgi:hypothetical protein